MVTPEIPTFAFDSALLVALAWSTEAGLEPPVGTEGNEANRFFPPLAAQDLPDR